jgi:predicted dehydrogenase
MVDGAATGAKINLAIVGLGRWGVHLLRNFLALPEAEVVAVVEANADRLSQLQSQFRIPNGGQWYSQWQTAFALEGLDAVVIATPASTHYDLIGAALERGLHVLSEKPLTLESSTCKTLCHLAASQQRQLVVDHTYLFHPAVQRGQDLCQQGILGDLRYAYAARTNLGPVRPDADALWDLAIHDLAILNHWMGQEPIRVNAWGSIWLQPQPQAQFPHGLRDVGWVRVTYPGGVEATVQASWLNPDKQRRLGLVGTQGTLVFDEMQPDHPLTLYPGHLEPQGTAFVPMVAPANTVEYAAAEPLAQACRHFLACVRQQQPSPLSSGAMATRLVQVMEAITQSAEQATEITLPWA